MSYDAMFQRMPELPNVKITMEMAVVSFVTVAVAMLMYCVFQGNWLQLESDIRARRSELPRGSLGWPVLGELASFANAFKTATPYIWSAERRKKYGNMFLTHLFWSPSIFVTDNKDIKFILSQDNNTFVAAYPKGIVTMIFGQTAILNQHGERHKVLRKVYAYWSRTASLISSMQDHERFSRLRLESLEGRNFSLLPTITEFTSDLLLWKLLRVPPGPEAREIMKLVEVLRNSSFAVPLNIPGTAHHQAQKTRSSLIVWFKRIAEERKSQGNAEGCQRDFLDALLEKDECGRQILSANEIADNLIFSIVAGHAGPARTMAFTIMYLTENPDTLKELKKEHDRIREEIGPSSPISWVHYKQMTFTQQVINETLRIVNVSGEVFRKPIDNILYEGLLLPKGLTLILSPREVHTNPNIYPDPYKFDTSRWENPQPAGQFIPFGTGRHKCPGMEFARMEISIFLHHLVTNYSWKIVRPYKTIFFPMPDFRPELILQISKLGEVKV